MDNNYPPYVFQDSEGRLQGILIDEWHLWEQKTGIKAEISAMDWGKAISRMQAGEFDVIDTIFETEKRALWLDFLPGYATIEVPIFFNRDITGITDAASLKGFVVAAKAGDAAVEHLKRNGIDNLLLFDSYEAVIRAAEERKVNVFVVDKPPALYFLYKFNIHDRFRQSATLYVGEFHRAVKKGRGDLFHLVEEGFGRITPDELKIIEDKWSGSSFTGVFPLWKFFIAVGSFGFLILVLYSWNHSLRNAVSARTAELKTSIEALRKSEERHRTILHAAMDGFWLTDMQGYLLEVNNAYCLMSGYSPQELLAMRISDLEAVEAAEEVSSRIQEIKDKGEARFETLHRRKDGSIFDVEVSIQYRLIEGGRCVAFLRDITDRKNAEKALRESEEKYRSLFEETQDIVFIAAFDGEIIDINPAGVSRLGYSSKEDITRLASRDLYADHEDRTHYLALLDENGFVVDYPATLLRRNGQPLHVSVNATVIRDTDGKIAMIRGIMRDITEHRNLESQLRQAQKMESVGTLAGGVAHDFNNILSAIVGYGHLALMKMAADDPNRLNLQHMLEASEKAAHLTRDLLLFSRKQAIDRRPVDLNETIGRMQKFLVRVIGEDIICKTTLSEKKLMVSADSHQLEQVIMNLATNARDAMPKGGTFSITTEEADLTEEFTVSRGLSTPGRYALISISDTGHGMASTISEKIFEPFFTTKEVGRGTGLGLAVVYGIIRQHDGHISVYSEEGIGSTFRIYLPLMAALQTDDRPAKLEERPVRGGNETVLMAEDEEALRKLNHSVLREYGYTVIDAVDGEDAVALFRENKDRVQLLLFDLIMPRMNGSEAYDEIRKIRPDIKVIFASGYSPDIVRQKVLLDEDAELIYKPISPFDLLRKVREVLDRGTP